MDGLEEEFAEDTPEKPVGAEETPNSLDIDAECESIQQALETMMDSSCDLPEDVHVPSPIHLKQFFQWLNSASQII